MLKEKYITIALILILTITVLLNISLFLKIQANSKLVKEKQDIIAKNDDININFYKDMTFYETTNNITYYKVVSCAESFFWAINDLWTNEKSLGNGQEEVLITNDNNNSYKINKLLGILGEKYIEQNKINVNNIYNKISHIESGKIVCNTILEYNLENNITVYYVRGTNVVNENKKSDFILMVIMDNNKNCFAIYPEDYLKEKGLDKINVGDKTTKDFEKIKNIKLNQYNKIQNVMYSDEDIIDNYYDLYTLYLKQDINTAYDLLDAEYKEKKFNNIDEFKAFIVKKYNNIFTNLKGYQVEYNKQHKQYIVMDMNNNYYIFRETAPMKYSVILDTYTLDFPEFVEKYESGNSQIKTALNIQKIVDALNDEDYNYVYGKLAQEFKQNNFSTVESFEQYASKTFGQNNEVTYNSFIETSNYCTYDITIKNKENEAKKTIIMKLQEGTDFVFSFNVD